MPTSIYESAGMAIHTADGDGVALPPSATVRQVAPRWWTCVLAGSDNRLAIHVARIVSGEALAAFFGSVEDKVALRDWFRAQGGEAAAPGSLWGRRLEPRLALALRYWPTWTCRGLMRVEDDGGVRSESFNGKLRINPRGLLPVGFLSGVQVYLNADGNEEATPASAFYRIDQVFRPSVATTLAGHPLPTLIDEELDE